MRSWTVYLKQNKTKHENLGGETVRVFNTIIHCINYSNVF